jgi:hypothetical protein
MDPIISNLIWNKKFFFIKLFYKINKQQQQDQ